jgi:crotonobetainyl-CoA:carnitine CoA-transferase CaiB-like acyl-CoA transferase
VDDYKDRRWLFRRCGELAHSFKVLPRMQILDPFRVLSLAINLPGPLAVARLRALGATVRKVEPPSGDPLQQARPEWYRLLHEGVEVQRLDLKLAGERSRLEPWLAEADLLVTASRTSALERLGLGWDELHRRFPDLSQVAIVGHAAPDEERPGHDLLYQAEHGLVQPPALSRTCLADFGGALEAVLAALQLLWARRLGQPGQRLSVSLAQSAAWFAEPVRQGVTTPGGILGGGFAGYNVYRAARGWVALAALEPHFQRALADDLGLSGLDAGELQARFLTRTADEWVTWARERNLPLVKIVL